VKKVCFLLVFKDTLFKQTILGLLKEMDNVDLIESKAEDAGDLFKEVVKYRANTILMDESSPLSAAAPLFHLLMSLPGRQIVLISKENNLIHVAHWRTIQVDTAADLFKSITIE
jgi:hypothetical protein